MSPRSTLLGLVVTAALVGCSPDEPAAEPRDDPTTERPSATAVVRAGDEYVALGDSYTAAPGIGESDGRDGCVRSRNNYPHLVAEQLDLELTDVSCGGASTTSLTGSQRTLTGEEVDPQFDALGPATDLVTIRIGGNDFALYQLISRICPALAARDPEGHPCRDEADKAEQDLDDLLDELEDRVVSAVRTVVRMAPDATVLVVGYPSVVPEDGTCSELPLADGDYPFALQVNRGLNAALKTAARSADVRYVDLYEATRGHDICGEDPWVAGRTTIGGKGVAWHPFASEQKATAAAIVAALQGP
ncbi:SGNH/GDSL hydrolase family protein [Nocardioides sp. HM23]|uniref:SGNH/GDSL hydrolase family protein n=1 Tax=Nocardioides bizhenqiangii TaxID=3095076 RepID=UPI002ACA0DBA|nr:SGNH/GDSL hydrolase family protein [Nocardioides sp. HM23]MDZ5620017.1 SGNH/GDSL hydrolase family protein [Nocardioides sp. HM23]